MRYITLNTFQLLIMTLLTGLIAAALSVSFSIYSEYRLLPIVTVTGTGECIKVVNFQNGHAFSCPDKDVLLRRYRTQLDVPQKAP